MAKSLDDMVNDAALELVRKRALKALEALKEETPVDTGEARAGWRVSFIDKGIKIINDVDHIEDLNEGSSQQAPSNFIEHTLMRFGKLKLR